jgi:hypothetical protein
MQRLLQILKRLWETNVILAVSSQLALVVLPIERVQTWILTKI